MENKIESSETFNQRLLNYTQIIVSDPDYIFDICNKTM